MEGEQSCGRCGGTGSNPWSMFKMNNNQSSLQDPMLILIDWNYGLNKQLVTPTSFTAFSQFSVELRQTLRNYRRCSLVYMYLNNFSQFNVNANIGCIGVNFPQIPGNIALATKGNITNSLIGVPQRPPTFLVPRELYFGEGVTGQPNNTTVPPPAYTVGPDTDSISFNEQYANQFSVDVAGLDISELDVFLCSESWFQLVVNSPLLVSNFECRIMLRFYN